MGQILGIEIPNSVFLGIYAGSASIGWCILRYFLKSHFKIVYLAGVVALTGLILYQGAEELKNYMDRKRYEEQMKPSKKYNDDDNESINKKSTTVEQSIDKNFDQNQCENIFSEKLINMIGKCCLDTIDCLCLSNNYHRNLLLKSCPKLIEKKLHIVCHYSSIRQAQQIKIQKNLKYDQKEAVALIEIKQNESELQAKDSKINITITLLFIMIDSILFLIILYQMRTLFVRELNINNSNNKNDQQWQL